MATKKAGQKVTGLQQLVTCRDRSRKYFSDKQEQLQATGSEERSEGATSPIVGPANLGKTAGRASLGERQHVVLIWGAVGGVFGDTVSRGLELSAGWFFFFLGSIFAPVVGM